MQITIRHLMECILVRNLSRDIEGKDTFATDQGVSVQGNAKKGNAAADQRKEQMLAVATTGKNKHWLRRPEERTNSGCGDQRKEQTLAVATREKNKHWLRRPEERTNTGCSDRQTNGFRTASHFGSTSGTISPKTAYSLFLQRQAQNISFPQIFQISNTLRRPYARVYVFVCVCVLSLIHI